MTECYACRPSASSASFELLPRTFTTVLCARLPLLVFCATLAAALFLPIAGAQAQVVIEERVEVGAASTEKPDTTHRPGPRLESTARWTRVGHSPLASTKGKTGVSRAAQQQPRGEKPKMQSKAVTEAGEPSLQAVAAAEATASQSGVPRPMFGRFGQQSYTGDPVTAQVQLIQNGAIVWQAPVNTNQTQTLLWEEPLARGDEIVVRVIWQAPDGTYYYADHLASDLPADPEASWTLSLKTDFYRTDGIHIGRLLHQFNFLVGNALANSDHNGTVDVYDSRAEYEDDRVGALFTYNADDDNGNGIPDYADDEVTGENDLGLLALSFGGEYTYEPGPNLTARLEFLSGAENFKLWQDPSKTDSVSLPLEVSVDSLTSGSIYYVEGVRWDTVQTELRLSVMQGGTLVSADTLNLYAAPPYFELPAEVEAGTEMLVSVEGYPAGTDVDFTLYKNGAQVDAFTETVEGRSAARTVPISTTAGDTYYVDITADQGSLAARSDTVMIMPGPAAQVSYDVQVNGQSSSEVPSDDNMPAQVTLTARDSLGNLVADGTGVSWNLNGSQNAFESRENATAGGQAQATVRASWRPNEIASVATVIDGYQTSTQIQNRDASVTLSTSSDSLTSKSGEEVTLTANVTDGSGNPVPDGTAISWFSQKGELVNTDATVQGGTATATLQASGLAQKPGTSVVQAYVGSNVGSATVEFTYPSDPCLFIEFSQPVLAGDIEHQDGVDQFVDVEQRDGSFERYQVHTRTEAAVYGEPGTTVRVSSVAQEGAVALVGKSGVPVTDGPVEVVLDMTGRGYFEVLSTGAFNDADHPDQNLMKVELEAEVTGTSTNSVNGRQVNASTSGGAGTSNSTTDCIGETTTATIALAKKSFLAKTLDMAKKFGWGAITGNADSFAAVAGDVTLSALPVVGIYADGRDTVKELFRLWPGGDDPDYTLLTFAGLGLASELPIFQGPVNAVFASIKGVVKLLTTDAPLRKAIFKYFKKHVKNVNKDKLLEAGPLAEKLLLGESFRDLALNTLVKSGDDFGNLLRMFDRVGGDDAVRYLEELPQQYPEYLPSKKAREAAAKNLARAFGKLSDENFASLENLGKQEILAKGIVAQKWGVRKAENYIGSVEDLGKDNVVVRFFNQYADKPGSNRILNRGDEGGKALSARGVQGEMRAGDQILPRRGETLEAFEVNKGVPGDGDLITDESVIQVKELRSEARVAENVQKFTSDGGAIDGIKALSMFGDYAGKTPVLAISDLVQNYPNELAKLQRAATEKGVALEFFD